MLIGLNKTFYHNIVSSTDIEAYISKFAGYDCSGIFNQYLRKTNIPELQYRVTDGKLSYRWENTVPGFSMKLKVYVNDKLYWVTPRTDWQSFKVKKNKMVTDFKVDPNYYIKVNQLK